MHPNHRIVENNWRQLPEDALNWTGFNGHLTRGTIASEEVRPGPASMMHSGVKTSGGADPDGRPTSGGRDRL